MEVKEMVYMGERLGAAEMHWEDAGTRTRRCWRLGTKVGVVFG